MAFNRNIRRIMRLKEVIQVCGIGRSTIYLWMNQGQFPKCHRIGARAVGWDSKEIDCWVSHRLGEKVGQENESEQQSSSRAHQH